jgi:hypothetical protein
MSIWFYQKDLYAVCVCVMMDKTMKFFVSDASTIINRISIMAGSLSFQRRAAEFAAKGRYCSNRRGSPLAAEDLPKPFLVSRSPMSNDELVISNSPTHPANLICELCRLFYGRLPVHAVSDNIDNGWVTGTGGGMTIRHELPLTNTHLTAEITFTSLQVESKKRYSASLNVVDL